MRALSVRYCITSGGRLSCKKRLFLTRSELDPDSCDVQIGVGQVPTRFGLLSNCKGGLVPDRVQTIMFEYYSDSNRTKFSVPNQAPFRIEFGRGKIF